MNIVVCVKYVPDAAGERGFTDGGGTDRSAAGLLSELDEYAVEAALALRESGVVATDPEQGAITVLTMGPAGAEAALKKALQMGADEGVHLLDEALAGSDALATSATLAAAIRLISQQRPVDLVLTGMASTDGGMSVLPAMLAERLGMSQVTFASALTITDAQVQIRRDGDTSSDTITATLPAVVSVTDQANEPRYPGFKGIMAAKKKPVRTVTLADLSLSAADVGWAAAATKVHSITPRPPREQGLIVTDDGQGGQVLAHYLSLNKFL